MFGAIFSIKRTKENALPKGKKLRFGDVVFVDDRRMLNLTSGIIRYVETGGKIIHNKFTPNHVAIVTAEHSDIRKVTITQATCGGVNSKPLSIYIDSPGINVEVKRFKGTLRYKRKMKLWLREQEGKRYDYGAIAGIGLRYLVMKYAPAKVDKWLKDKKNPLASKQKFICSALAYEAYQQARIQLWHDCDKTNITPWDTYRSEKLKSISKIHNFSYCSK